MCVCVCVNLCSWVEMRRRRILKKRVKKRTARNFMFLRKWLPCLTVSHNDIITDCGCEGVQMVTMVRV